MPSATKRRGSPSTVPNQNNTSPPIKRRRVNAVELYLSEDLGPENGALLKLDEDAFKAQESDGKYTSVASSHSYVTVNARISIELERSRQHRIEKRSQASTQHGLPGQSLPPQHTHTENKNGTDRTKQDSLLSSNLQPPRMEEEEEEESQTTADPHHGKEPLRRTIVFSSSISSRSNQTADSLNGRGQVVNHDRRPIVFSSSVSSRSNQTTNSSNGRGQALDLKETVPSHPPTTRMDWSANVRESVVASGLPISYGVKPDAGPTDANAKLEDTLRALVRDGRQQIEPNVGIKSPEIKALKQADFPHQPDAVAQAKRVPQGGADHIEENRSTSPDNRGLRKSIPLANGMLKPVPRCEPRAVFVRGGTGKDSQSSSHPDPRGQSLRSRAADTAKEADVSDSDQLAADAMAADSQAPASVKTEHATYQLQAKRLEEDEQKVEAPAQLLRSKNLAKDVRSWQAAIESALRKENKHLRATLKKKEAEIDRIHDELCAVQRRNRRLVSKIERISWE